MNSHRAAPRTAWMAVLVLAVSVLVAGFTTMGRSTTTHRNTEHAAVLGYIESGDGLPALRRNLPALTSVGIDGVNISSSGATVSQPDAYARAMLSATHRAGKTAELLIGNYSDTTGDFDPDAAHALFASTRHRSAVIAALVADARHGWNGLQLDFESLHASDAAGLTKFTAGLRAALSKHTSLSMAVMASTTAQGYRDNGYRLPALARQLTRVVLMAYDQHGPTWTGPGPVGGLPWAERAIAVMLRSVPKSKTVFGVAGYGYTWPTHHTGTQLGDTAARRAAETPTWSATQAEWHATLRGGGTLWWSDAKSLKVRRALGRTLGIRGVAVWSLGSSDVINR